MAPRTSFRLGGSTSWLLEPTDEGELVGALAWARQEGVEVFAMGRGSNLVVSDLGWPGAILRLSENFSHTGKAESSRPWREPGFRSLSWPRSGGPWRESNAWPGFPGRSEGPSS